MERKDKAQNQYMAAKERMLKYCEENTDLTPIVREEEYPFVVQYLPDPQQKMFGDDNVDENGEFNDLTVTVGLTTTVKSTLKFKMDSAQLKKLIRLAEAVGYLYYQAYREQADYLRQGEDAPKDGGENNE